MGGGFFDREVVSIGPTSSAAASQASSQALSQRSFAEELTPFKKNITCANGTPIVIALDISGSMATWPRIFYDKLPMFYGQLCLQDYVSDPALSFAAFAGGRPLQASDFAQGTDIDDILSKLWLCGGGGDGEPYADAAYFFQSQQVNFTGLQMKPFFFFTGDERMSSFGPKLEQNVKATIDPDSDGPFDHFKVWDSLMEKYHVFLVAKPGGDGFREEWEQILGKERVLMLKTPKACVDCVLGAIAIVSQQRTLEEFREDLKERGQDAERQEEVIEALRGVPFLYPRLDGAAQL